MNASMPLRPAPDWRNSIVSRTSMAIVGIALIGMIVIGASERIAERIQGSGVAINEVGNLRRLSHRLANVALTSNTPEEKAELAGGIGALSEAIVSKTLHATVDRASSTEMDASYLKVQHAWYEDLEPALLRFTDAAARPPEAGPALLASVEGLVDNIDQLVGLLERDTEDRIRHLRLTLAASLGLILILLVPTLILLKRRVAEPMEELVASAGRIARGDFNSRISYKSADELGHLAESFNLMSSQLSGLYGDMERQVAAKTAELTRSNRSLKLLYDSISHLHNASNQPESYRKVLDDLEEVLGLTGSLLCALPKHGGMPSILASSIGNCADRGIEECLQCPEFAGRTSIIARSGGQGSALKPSGQADALRHNGVLRVLSPDGSGTKLRQLALRDAERHYGVLRVLLEEHQELAPWQEQLLEAVARHIGIALGTSFQSERDRLIALQEERSTIARELHDSLAQSLSYMKIQASLLQPMLGAPGRLVEAQVVLGDLREGINSAYRQLRELLSTFRLRMEGDFINLLNVTANEFSARSGVPIALNTRLDGCHLTPNQEIHALHVIREALSNMTRHAEARWARVLIEQRDRREIVATIEDDGIGPQGMTSGARGNHGTAIMTERARSLGGSLEIRPRSGGGTLVTLRFPAEQQPTKAEGQHD